MNLAAVSRGPGPRGGWFPWPSPQSQPCSPPPLLLPLPFTSLTRALVSPVPPQVVTPPQEFVQASRGQTVTFTCVAIGVPTPIINWRLNWGHIPSHPRYGSEPGQGPGRWGTLGQWRWPDPTTVSGPSRVTVTSEGGRGTLTIRDVKEADQGAYTCEAMNARGMVFGIPDGVLELIPKRGTAGGQTGPRHGGGAGGCLLVTGCNPLPCHPPGPCTDGHFYLEPTASCLPCFCFGVTSVCQSSRRFRDQIQLRFDRPDDFKGASVGGQEGGAVGVQGQAPGLERRKRGESSIRWQLGPGSRTGMGGGL